jgi:hypothetical protein
METHLYLKEYWEWRDEERIFENYESVLKPAWKSIAYETDIYRVIWEPDDYEEDHPSDIIPELERGLNFLLSHTCFINHIHHYVEFVRFLQSYIAAIKEFTGSYICID